MLSPCLSVVFRRLVRLGSFPPCLRQANVTPIPKGSPSSSVANYRPIFITSVLSKVFERLGRFIERNGVLPTTLFPFRKGPVTYDALLCVSHTLQSALESGQEARIAQIDFSAALDKVSHQGILYWLCFVGVGGSVLSILFLFLFLDSFLNSCGCSTAKSKTPPKETIFLPTYRYRAWVSTIPDHS